MGARASRKDHGAIGGGEAEDKKTLADSTSRALSTERLSELGKVKYIRLGFPQSGSALTAPRCFSETF